MKRTKKQLRQRLLDIGLGAGHWDDQDGDDWLAGADFRAFGMFLRVLQSVFFTQHGDPWREMWFGEFDSLDKLTDHLWGYTEIREGVWTT